MDEFGFRIGIPEKIQISVIKFSYLFLSISVHFFRRLYKGKLVCGRVIQFYFSILNYFCRLLIFCYVLSDVFSFPHVFPSSRLDGLVKSDLSLPILQRLCTCPVLLTNCIRNASFFCFFSIPLSLLELDHTVSSNMRPCISLTLLFRFLSSLKISINRQKWKE